MKIRHFSILLPLLVFLISGCNKEQNDILELGGFPPSADAYLLCIGFKDASGNDLVAPLGDEKWKPEMDLSPWVGEINPDKYNLNIILSNKNEKTSNSIKEKQPYFLMNKFDKDYNHLEEGAGYWYLFNETQCPGKNGIQDSLSYIITCPTIFGDNSSHQLITWWRNETQDQQKDRDTGLMYPECVKASFDGNVLPVKKVYFTQNVFSFYAYFIDIVLE